MDLGGLIGAALKGGGEGYAAAAKGEMEQQQKIDYQQKYLQMLEEKEARADERRQELEIAGIPRKAVATAQGEAAARGVKIDADKKYLQPEADLAAGREVAGIDATIAAGLPEKRAELKGRGIKADAPNVEEVARQEGSAEGIKQTTKTKTPGYAASVRAEADAKESSSVKGRNNREQQDWERSAKARDAVAEYTSAVDAGDDAAAKAARLKAIRLGVDPAATKRGQMKVLKNDDGTESLVYEDSNGNISNVDPKTLQTYEPKLPKVGNGGIPAPKSADELAKLAPGTQYRAPDGTVRTKSK